MVYLKEETSYQKRGPITMLDLNKICQPGERITIVTREAVIVGIVPLTYHPHGSAEPWAAQPLDPIIHRERLYLHTRSFPGCALGVGSEVGIEVQLVRLRGQD